MIERAGYPGIAADLDEAKARRDAAGDQEAGMEMREEGLRLTGKPGLPLEPTPNLAAAE